MELIFVLLWCNKGGSKFSRE